MQVYKGLDVLTNKATEKEMEGIKHHLISFVDPIKDEQFDVNKFLEFSRGKINEMNEKGSIPILVGKKIIFHFTKRLLMNNLKIMMRE